MGTFLHNTKYGKSIEQSITYHVHAFERCLLLRGGAWLGWLGWLAEAGPVARRPIAVEPFADVELAELLEDEDVEEEPDEVQGIEEADEVVTRGKVWKDEAS